jgi:indole-3-glycerol phosphate synthase
VQASTAWTAPGGVLGTILSETRDRIRALRTREGELSAARGRGAHRAFASALRRPSVAIIAEIKRRSPSKGDINVRMDVAGRAAAYSEGGAAAISVLTEPTHFGGSAEDFLEVSDRVRIPILRKDFHLHPVQLLEARALGASAVLLIARALEPTLLMEMMAEASALGLEAMVEVRTEGELERALGAGASVIGVNSRDLETLEVDAMVCERLVPRIPPHVVAVWESGLSTAADVELAAARGADAVLVGSSLSASRQAAAAVRALAAVSRVGRDHG